MTDIVLVFMCNSIYCCSAS